MSEDLLKDVHRMKLQLLSTATSDSYDGGFDYDKLRLQFLKTPRIEAKLPEFVRMHRTLREFWPFIKRRFSTYQERRDYIHQEFDPLMTMLESDIVTPSDDLITGRLKLV